MTLHRNTRRVVEAANRLGIDVAVTRYPEGTRTAVDAAAAIGCDVAAIVKSIVCVADTGPVLVLTSGTNRVDYVKVEAALGVTGVRRADAEEVRAATGFPIGGSAPFGHPAPLPIVLDRDLLAYDQVWAAAGTPDTVFPISPVALRTSTDAEVADVAE